MSNQKKNKLSVTARLVRQFRRSPKLGLAVAVLGTVAALLCVVGVLSHGRSFVEKVLFAATGVASAVLVAVAVYALAAYGWGQAKKGVKTVAGEVKKDLTIGLVLLGCGVTLCTLGGMLAFYMVLSELTMGASIMLAFFVLAALLGLALVAVVGYGLSQRYAGWHERAEAGFVRFVMTVGKGRKRGPRIRINLLSMRPISVTDRIRMWTVDPLQGIGLGIAVLLLSVAAEGVLVVYSWATGGWKIVAFLPLLAAFVLYWILRFCGMAFIAMEFVRLVYHRWINRAVRKQKKSGAVKSKGLADWQRHLISVVVIAVIGSIGLTAAFVLPEKVFPSATAEETPQVETEVATAPPAAVEVKRAELATGCPAGQKHSLVDGKCAVTCPFRDNDENRIYLAHGEAICRHNGVATCGEGGNTSSRSCGSGFACRGSQCEPK